MEKISELQAVKSAIRRHFKAGMATNCVLNDRDLIREIEAGALYTEENEGALLILRDRGSHYILNYYVNSLPLPPLPEKMLVCEITARGGENIRRISSPPSQSSAFPRGKGARGYAARRVSRRRTSGEISNFPPPSLATSAR